MRTVELTGGGVALVDDEDFETVSRFTWQRATAKKNPKPYARASIRLDGWPKQKGVAMHRLIMGLPPSEVHIDHANGDTLNNQRFNLRIATRSQNAANSPKRSKTNLFKGVRKRHDSNRWEARICVSGRLRYLGVFKSELEAATVYNKEAEKAWGAFALLNDLSKP